MLALLLWAGCATGEPSAGAPASVDAPPSGPRAASAGTAESTARPSRWYGSQTLAVDGVSLGLALLLAGTQAAPGPGVGLGVCGYAFGAPIVHFAHGRVGTGFGSFGLRVGMPIVAGLLGIALTTGWRSGSHSRAPGFDGIVGGGVGAGVGAIGAISIDAAVLAYEPAAPEPTAAPLGSTSLSFALRSTATTKAVSVSGTF